MNIDEFRAMKAEMEKEAQNPTPQGGEPNAQAEPATNAQPAPEQEEITAVPQVGGEEAKPNQDGETLEQAQPTTIEIDGQEVTIDELKSGYLRQSDYTKKTQEIKRKEQQAEEALRLIEQLQQNPQVAQELSQQFQMPNLDPAQAQFSELENKYFDLLIQSELRDLRDKYGQFDEQEVLQIAGKEGINNLDTAYHIMTSRKGGGGSEPTMNIDEIKQQLRDELLKELNLEKDASADTSTIIRTGGGSAPITTKEPTLSAQELKVATMMGMDKFEYFKWKNARK